MASPAELAKRALRRLAQARLEPTPANFQLAYDEEASAAGLERPAAPAAGRDDRGPADAPWPALIERLVRGLERGSAQWTTARRKDSLQRVLVGSGGDPERLLRRLQPLVAAWDGGAAEPAPVADGNDGAEDANGADDAGGAGDATGVGRDTVTTDAADGGGGAAAGAGTASSAPGARAAAPPPVEAPAMSAPPSATTVPAVPSPGARPAPAPGPAPADAATTWPAVTTPLLHALRETLPADAPSAPALADELAALADRLAQEGAQPALVQAVARACERARWLVGHRQDLLAAVGGLCRELGEGLVELAEDESWARGQCQALQARLAGGLNPRSVGSATALLAETRRRQRALRSERQAANQALKTLIRSLLDELAALGAQTERFEARVDRHARAIAQADSLQGLGGVVGELLQDTRTAQDLVRRTRERLQQDESRAGALERRVRELEGELRRLSDEVATDGLTRVANRRGLERAFAAEVARAAQAPADAAALAVGLIDIDDFKRLNDTLGHQAGDEALKALAAGVQARLRQGDTVARFGGEEFVLLLPGTSAADGQQRLTQLQRGLSASLFLHEGREVFVTFSAGVTAWRPGEALDAALQRADEALYQAKRTGKNRTCVA